MWAPELPLSSHFCDYWCQLAVAWRLSYVAAPCDFPPVLAEAFLCVCVRLVPCHVDVLVDLKYKSSVGSGVNRCKFW